MVGKENSYNPNFVVHPGETLKDELEFLGLTQVELSKRMGITEKHISQIINGLSSITPEMALKLEFVLGVPAVFWNNLQNNYELNVARIKFNENIEKQIGEAKKFSCYNELVEYGYVEKTSDWNARTRNLLSFFGVDSLSYVLKTESVAFRQNSNKFDQRSLAAWLRCGYIDSIKIDVEEFKKEKVKEVIPKLKKLTFLPDGFGDELRKICASVGIAVVYKPYFKNTMVNGSARWIGDKAVIQLNTKGAYADIFWFTFFHELGHILLHGLKDEFVDFANNKAKNEKEIEANDFARDMLLSPSEYDELISMPLNKKNIKSFAEKIGVSVDIILGRLAHEEKVSWKEVSRIRNRLVIT